MDREQAEKFTRRLTNAATKFWPRLSEEARADRVADVLLEILERESRGDEDHTISWWAKHMYRRCHDRALKNKEIAVEDMGTYLATARPTQENFTAAHQALRLVLRLPNAEKTAILLRADGANPVEISDEMGLPIMDVMGLIERARLYVGRADIYLWDGDESDRDFAA